MQESQHTITDRKQMTVFKPDFAEACRHWQAFWQGELIDRPLIVVTSPKEAGIPIPPRAYLEGVNGDFAGPAENMIKRAAATYYGGDAIPVYTPSFGPDQFAGFLGAKLQMTCDESNTSWAEPFVTDWDSVIPFTYQQNLLWQRMQQFYRVLTEKAEGMILMGHLDMHSNLDALAAMRGAEQLCLDMIDHPEIIDKAMSAICPVYKSMYETLDGIANGPILGRSSWIHAFCDKKFNTIQCDFIAMIGPDMFRRWVLPALHYEATFLDHTIFHLDGPGALKHVDDILNIKEIDCISWVPGAGQPPIEQWVDLLQKIQTAGKSVHIAADVDAIKILHPQLMPNKVFYQTRVQSVSEADELVEWLVNNT